MGDSHEPLRLAATEGRGHHRRARRAPGSAAASSRAAPDGLPPGCRSGGAFPKAASKGYDTAQVDAFLEHAASATVAEIRGAAFGTVRKGGYDMDAVDAALDRLEHDARRAGR